MLFMFCIAYSFLVSGCTTYENKSSQDSRYDIVKIDYESKLNNDTPALLELTHCMFEPYKKTSLDFAKAHGILEDKCPAGHKTLKEVPVVEGFVFDKNAIESFQAWSGGCMHGGDGEVIIRCTTCGYTFDLGLIEWFKYKD